MNIASLLAPEDDLPQHTNVTDKELMPLWETWLRSCGFKLTPAAHKCKLTDAILEPELPTVTPSQFVTSTPLHVKIVGRYMNGSFRCHIGIGKASRPICSSELDHNMRLLVVFFRPEKSNASVVSPGFVLFPTWLLHLFRYTRHANAPGRTDIRFLEDERLAKEDHIYRLNHIINTLFRFNLYDYDAAKLRVAVELSNFLFSVASLDEGFLLCSEDERRPRPLLYSTLVSLLRSPRPPKLKPVCYNCHTKPASRRELCVACYRYLLKHGESRPLRLIIANKHKRLSASTDDLYRNNVVSTADFISAVTDPANAGGLPCDCKPVVALKRFCANCGIQSTHQWYRNPTGSGYWCETCKGYYLRQGHARPFELFVRAARRKANAQTLVSRSTSSPKETATAARCDIKIASPMTTENQGALYLNTWPTLMSRRNYFSGS